MNPSAKIKIAITDDHQIVIDGLSAALRNFPHIEIVATATSGAAMMQLLKDTEIDLLITDIMMPGMDGQALSQAVRELYPCLRIIALSMNSNGDQVERMAPFINAYLLKQCGISELVTAIETVHNGGTYFDATVQEERRRYLRSQQNIKAVGITPREKQIIQLMEKDCSNKEIATQLCISIRTVETHRKNILRKTGATNVLTLIKWAYKQHLL
ncbi:MAG: response regulator transcription factor [Sphingobacteriales bacterium]|nr:MAG: response regulator transcription factor [Sphingobacteriales bacterium]